MLLKLLSLLCQVVLLSGFSIELLFCGIAANWLINEPRPVMGCIEDITISHQISRKLTDDPHFEKKTHITPISYNQLVLLIGQAPSQALKQQVCNYATHTPHVRRVFNQVTISPPIDIWRRIQDKLLLKLVQAKLLLTSNLRYHHFKIITENGEVFILGKAQIHEANLVATTIQTIPGIKKVTKLVEPA